jgi:hypothetical protein
MDTSMRIFIECKDIDEKHIGFLINEISIDLKYFITLKSMNKIFLLYTIAPEDNLYYHFTNATPIRTDETYYYDNSDAFVEHIQQLKLLRLSS